MNPEQLESPKTLAPSKSTLSMSQMFESPKSSPSYSKSMESLKPELEPQKSPQARIIKVLKELDKLIIDDARQEIPINKLTAIGKQLYAAIENPQLASAQSNLFDQPQSKYQVVAWSAIAQKLTGKIAKTLDELTKFVSYLAQEPNFTFKSSAAAKHLCDYSAKLSDDEFDLNRLQQLAQPNYAQIKETYLQQAQNLDKDGDYADAAILYTKARSYKLAAQAWVKAKDYKLEAETWAKVRGYKLAAQAWVKAKEQNKNAALAYLKEADRMSAKALKTKPTLNPERSQEELQSKAYANAAKYYTLAATTEHTLEEKDLAQRHWSKAAIAYLAAGDAHILSGQRNLALNQYRQAELTAHQAGNEDLEKDAELKIKKITLGGSLTRNVSRQSLSD